jgi:two-component sensor histidine kinase
MSLANILLNKKRHSSQTQEMQSELEQKLYEKDILLKEVHHRVKNNLQTVCSLLNMQSRGTEDEQMKNLISSSQNRVMAMAMVHEMLYLRDDLSTIDYKPYVFKLTEYLVKSVKGPDSKVKLAIDIPEIELGIDTAIPLGLLINETITNSLKYGIKDDSEGEIHIELKKEDENDYVLTIGDNGIGISEAVDPKTTKSLGLKLIYNLARQLKGSITRDWSRKGTNYIIKFKDVAHEPFHNMA